MYYILPPLVISSGGIRMWGLPVHKLSFVCLFINVLLLKTRIRQHLQANMIINLSLLWCHKLGYTIAKKREKLLPGGNQSAHHWGKLGDEWFSKKYIINGKYLS